MEITVTIAAPSFAAKHPEIHHYTTYDGLKGIVESRTLWATHFLHLNDATEVTLLQAPLAETIAKRAAARMEGPQGPNRHTRRAIKRSGGLQCSARAFVRSLYGATFESTTPLAEPYITSFCTHSTDERYEIDHGLLSQWRGYGGVGGFCIVFDTAALVDLLAREYDSHYWIYMQIAQVRYALTGFGVEELFPHLLDRCDQDFFEALQGGPVEIASETVSAFFEGAPLFKHQGFKEEREVRIVAIPGTQRVMEKMRIEHKDFMPSPLKAIHSTDGARGPHRYLALFDDLNAQLRIKRVIVGPSQDQAKNFARASEVLGASIALARSDTPFIG